MPFATFSRARSYASVSLAMSALALALAACGGGDSTAPAVPQQLTKTAGDGVSAAVASTTPSSPTLKVTSDDGRPVRGIVVNFAVSGGGSVAAAVDTTDASGIATSGAWTLGSTMGAQTVTASSPSVSGVTATFTATATAEAPAMLVFITQPPASVSAGESFQGPVVEIRDRFGNRTNSTLTVSLGLAGDQGPATLSGVTSVAAVDGRATFGQLSTSSTGLLTLVASATGTGAALSSSIAVASGAVATITKISGDVQLGDAGTNVFLPPIAKVTDSFGNPVAGGLVTFTVVSGGGSISNTTVASGTDGIAKLTRWTLGPSAGNNVVRASAGAITADFTATATANPYHIELRYINLPTRRQQDAFESAWQKWRGVITGDIPSYNYNTVNVCGLGMPLNETIDDMVIYVKLAPIDGPGKILGSAGPCAANPANLLPFVGNMTFDTADLTSLENSGQLNQVIVHEMGHVLGIGIGPIWEGKGLLQYAGTDSVGFSGAAAKAVWQGLGGAAGTRVPVENCVGYTAEQCGGGTRDSHWRERTFNNELMTGFLNGGTANPLSTLTIASLADLGYSVNMSAAEPYTLPPQLMAGSVGGSGTGTGTASLRALVEAKPSWELMIPIGGGREMPMDEWVRQRNARLAPNR